MKQPIVSVLAVLCAGLSGRVAIELGIIEPDGPLPAAEAVPPIPVPGPAQAGAPPLPMFRAAPAEASAVIIERPLFFPSRRPAEPEPVAAAPEPPAEVPDMALIGTIITTSGRRALVQTPPGTAALVLSDGQDVGGWTIAAIETDRVLLRRGGDEQAVMLENPAGAEAARSPPAKPSQVAQRVPSKAAAAERPGVKPASRGEQPRGGTASRTSFYTPR